MRPLLILKTGSTVPSVRARRGDFEDWFRAGLGFEEPGCDRDGAPVVDVGAGERPPPPGDLAGVVVTGSPSMITEAGAWSRAAEAWLAEAVGAGLPVLAVCYGHQMLARCLGGRAGWNPAGREIGTVGIERTPEGERDPLLGGLDPPLAVQTSHSQSVLALPPGARLLARNARDPHQAFAVGPRAFGLQFHPEFDADIVGGYLEERRAELAAEGIDVDAVAAAVRDTPVGGAVLRRFGELVRGGG